jgi:hypothetical protein
MVGGETQRPKRSLFSKPAFLPDVTQDSANGDLFHRSEQAYADIRAEQAAKHRLKQQKREEAARLEAEGSRKEHKRRRISHESDEFEHKEDLQKAAAGVDLEYVGICTT